MKLDYNYNIFNLSLVNRINLKLDSFRIIYEMLSKSLAGMRKMLELYRDPIYSKSFIKVLSTNFIHGKMLKVD